MAVEKALLVVESPTKMKTLGKYLGRNFKVRASVGHVMDLPKSKLGVEIGDRFEPVYEVIKGKQKIIDEIREAAIGVDTVYLAPDPDREGEAIAWHLAGQLAGKKKKKKTDAKIYRVLIEEITKKGVEQALKAPQELNRPRYESQQARRILDRLVGYKISPLLWQKVRRGLSAGRVQSVALRIICDRERDIKAFVAVEYWTTDAELKASSPPPFVARVITRNGKKYEIATGEQAKEVEGLLLKASIVVHDIVQKPRRKSPPPALTTSRLQQEGARKLGFTAKKTMMLAQQLYEGVELGAEGPIGLITYMRTDSTRLSNDSLEAVREYIGERYGKNYVPESPRFYRLSKRAQDAHEAIRPTLPLHPPESVAKFLKKDQLRLYGLIWDAFVACQMTEAVFEQTTIDIDAGELGLRATGSVLTSDGYLKVYVEGREEGEEESDEEKIAQFPPLKKGDLLTLNNAKSDQHFTKPPPRFSEAGLVKELEERGIGRPSTYASILSTLQDRKYAVKEQRNFLPTDLGFLVCDLLVEHFPEVLNVEFTALMENELDLVEDGEKDWQQILREFYDPFAKALKTATKKMRDVKREETPTEHNCEKCGKNMVIKWGRHGHFLACSGYPECRNTKEFRKSEDGKVEIVEKQETSEKCVECSAPMTIKTGRYGKFLACSRYPECKHTRSISTGVNCPEKDCGGQLLERRSRKGKTFYGCSKYPKCTHAAWDRPVAKPCPQCAAPYLVEKYTKTHGVTLRCIIKGCGYSAAEE